MRTELEAVEKLIQDLLEKQALLLERKTVLETSRADARKSTANFKRNCNSPTTSGAVVLHAEVNDIRMRQSEILL